MKIKIVSGRMTAEAETAEDMQILLGYAGKPVLGGKKPRKARKRMYAKPCPICGKRKKLMASHMRLAHPDHEAVREG